MLENATASEHRPDSAIAYSVGDSTAELQRMSKPAGREKQPVMEKLSVAGKIADDLEEEASEGKSESTIPGHQYERTSEPETVSAAAEHQHRQDAEPPIPLIVADHQGEQDIESEIQSLALEGSQGGSSTFAENWSGLGSELFCAVPDLKLSFSNASSSVGSVSDSSDNDTTSRDRRGPGITVQQSCISDQTTVTSVNSCEVKDDGQWDEETFPPVLPKLPDRKSISVIDWTEKIAQVWRLVHVSSTKR